MAAVANRRHAMRRQRRKPPLGPSAPLPPLCVLLAAAIIVAGAALAQMGGRTAPASHHHRPQRQAHATSGLSPFIWRQPPGLETGAAAERCGHRCQPFAHNERHQDFKSSTLKRRRRARRELRRRQAVELLVNRLRILESLDEQLRAFAEAAELAQQQRHEQQQQQQQAADAGLASAAGSQIFCRLELPATGGGGGESEPQSPCLADKRLLGQLPPYVLNLYRQLLFELHQEGANRSAGAQSADTVQLTMPYGAQIMRSFRQPKIALDEAAAFTPDARTNDGPNDWHSTRGKLKPSNWGLLGSFQLVSAILAVLLAKNESQSGAPFEQRYHLAIANQRSRSILREKRWRAKLICDVAGLTAMAAEARR